MSVRKTILNIKVKTPCLKLEILQLLKTFGHEALIARVDGLIMGMVGDLEATVSDDLETRNHVNIEILKVVGESLIQQNGVVALEVARSPSLVALIEAS